ncbi:hypothetical protein C8Q76DRAFT_782486, partial [Earliella scabrosa]
MSLLSVLPLEVLLRQSRIVSFVAVILDGVRYLKFSVIAVFVCNALHAFLVSITSFHIFVSRHGKTHTIYKVHWFSQAQLVVTAATVLIVQCYYLFRIWTLSKRLTLIIFLGSLVAASLAFSMALLVQILQVGSSIEIFTRRPTIEMALTATVATTEFLLTLTFIVLLVRARRGGARRSKRLVVRMASYAVSTGALTCLSAFLTLIVVSVPLRLVHASPHTTLTDRPDRRLAAETNLDAAVLHRRQHIRHCTPHESQCPREPSSSLERGIRHAEYRRHQRSLRACSARYGGGAITGLFLNNSSCTSSRQSPYGHRYIRIMGPHKSEITQPRAYCVLFS